MKLLVTGGSGFIGTNLIIRCLQLGYEICNVDIESPKIRSHDNFYKHCNIEDYSTLESVFINFKPDLVVHLAARTDLDGEALEQYNTNTIGVENVCKATISSGSAKKVVFASSMLVCKVGYIPKDSSDFCPDTVYGESKMHSEIIIHSFKEQLGDYCIIRPTSIWGPWFKVPYKNFFDIVLAGKFMHIGNKTAIKTYGYVENSVNQIISLANSAADLREKLVYIGDEPGLHISLWANLIAKEAGIRNPITVPYSLFFALAKFGDSIKALGVHFPMSSFRLKNMTTNNVLSCQIASEVNLYNSITVEVGIKKTLSWLKNRGGNIKDSKR